MKKVLLITGIVMTVAVSVLGKTINKPQEASIELSGHDFADTIRVEITNGAVIVPVEIAGRQKRLLFDTGAENGCWFGNQEEWMKPLAETIQARDINSTIQTIAKCQIPEMKMGRLSIKNYPVSMGGDMDGALCNRFDGLLGFDIVTKGLSFKLDTKDSLLIVTDRSNFFDKEMKGQPSVKYRLVKPSYPMVVMEMPFGSCYISFDSGDMSGGVRFSQQTLAQWFRTDKIRNTIEAMTVQQDTVLNTDFGVFGYASDTLKDCLIHLPVLKMGSLTVKDAYAISALKGSRMGAALLKHTSLIIDSPRKRYVFLPHDGSTEVTLNDRESQTRMKIIPPDSTGLLRAVVRKGSAAYEKGIRTGDYLVEVDDIPVSDICAFSTIRSRKKPGEEVRLLFRTPDGREKRVFLSLKN